MLRIVTIGGGTGSSVLLRGLRDLQEGSPFRQKRGSLDITAIVCASDNGGSSGRLSMAYGIPSVGDLRNCLVAISRPDSKLGDLFQYRFPQGDGFEGHALGNLIISALCLTAGSLGKAVREAGELLGLRGRVLPMSEQPVTLCAELGSGQIVRGETQISASANRIRRVWLEPNNPSAFSGVVEAIAFADVIVLGPGSLYTSVVPNLLVDDIGKEIRNSPALKVVVCNLMTEPGETLGFTATDHLKVLKDYIGGALDFCLLNDGIVEQSLLAKYRKSGAVPVSWNAGEIAALDVMPVRANLLADSSTHILHDPLKLASMVLRAVEEATIGVQATDAAAAFPLSGKKNGRTNAFLAQC